MEAEQATEQAPEQAQVQYFPPSVRRAMRDAGVVLSQQEILLAAQVEKVLADQGTVVPGSLQDVPQKNRSGVSKLLSSIKKR